MEPADAEPEHTDLAQRALAQLKEPPLYARIDLVKDLTGQPALIELELIEPNLYLSEGPGAAELLADAAVTRWRQ